MTWKERGKLSDENIKKIIELSKTVKVSQLVKMFCVDRATIHYHLKLAKIIIWNKRKKIVDKQKIVDKLPRRKTLKRGLNEGKSYKELLEIENEKRKKAGLWLYKPSKNKL